MQLLARIGAAAVGVFGLALGLWFFFSTSEAAQAFFVVPQGAAGIGTLRADMSSFFLVGSGFAFHAAWTGRVASLLPPMALYAVALTGRAYNLAVNGLFAGAITPMAVEALLILLLYFAFRTFPGRARR